MIWMCPYSSQFHFNFASPPFHLVNVRKQKNSNRSAEKKQDSLVELLLASVSSDDRPYQGSTMGSSSLEVFKKKPNSHLSHAQHTAVSDHCRGLDPWIPF